MRNEALAEAVHAMPGPVFAALDGGQFDDIPAALRRAGVEAKSLFLTQAGADAQVYGPWFADTYSVAALDRLIDLVGDKPAAVFWTCPAGPEAMFQHLRRLNEAIVPTISEAGEARMRAAEQRGEPSGPEAADYVAVRALFRHCDPRVLAQVLPVLGEAQFAQVLGPATLIVIPQEGRLGPLRAEPVSTVPFRPCGPLRLTIGQIQEIEASQSERSDLRLATFLRDATPDGCAHMSDRELLAFVKDCDADARELGITHERTIGKWALLAYLTKGRAGDAPALRAYVSAPEREPNAAFETVYSASLAELLALEKAGRI